MTLLASVRDRIRRLAVRYRRHKLLSAYARVARVRHDLGPGFTPVLYAYGQLERDGLATLRDGELVWHWPDRPVRTDGGRPPTHDDLVDEHGAASVEHHPEGFHSGGGVFEGEFEPLPDPDPADCCHECSRTGHDRCGCCGTNLCGMHHELQGGFCSAFGTIGDDVPACAHTVWGVVVNARMAYSRDDQPTVLVTPSKESDQAVYHVHADPQDQPRAPLCRPDERSKERVGLVEAVDERDLRLCERCEETVLEGDS